MSWRTGSIEGVELKPFQIFQDERGWLSEIFRSDEMLQDDFPSMGYLSLTNPGQSRGPHEHSRQTDLFAFFHGSYRLYLWDSRDNSITSGVKQVLEVGASNPMVVKIPPGVVHAYQNYGEDGAYVLNFPDALYAGEGKKEPVDEIRHEDNPTSMYSMDL